MWPFKASAPTLIIGDSIGLQLASVMPDAPTTAISGQRSDPAVLNFLASYSAPWRGRLIVSLGANDHTNPTVAWRVLHRFAGAREIVWLIPGNITPEAAEGLRTIPVKAIETLPYAGPDECHIAEDRLADLAAMIKSGDWPAPDWDAILVRAHRLHGR